MLNLQENLPNLPKINSMMNLPPIPSYSMMMTKKPMLNRNLSTNRSALSKTSSNLKLIKQNLSPDKYLLDDNILNDSVIKKMKFDSGSLYEFLDYEMGLKKPDELFKSHTKKKTESKNIDNQKDKLLEALRTEEKYDPISILKNDEHQEPKMIAKASKKFMSDLISNLYGEDLTELEKGLVVHKKKRKNINHRALILEELPNGNPIKNILESNMDKNINQKIDLLKLDLITMNSPESIRNSKKSKKTLAIKNPANINDMIDSNGNSARESSAASSVSKRSLSQQKPLFKSKKTVELNTFQNQIEKAASTSKITKYYQFEPKFFAQEYVTETDQTENQRKKKGFFEQRFKESMVLANIKKSYESEFKSCRELYEKYLHKNIGDNKEQEALKYQQKIFYNPYYLFMRNTLIKPQFILYFCLHFPYFEKLVHVDLENLNVIQDILTLLLELILKCSSFIKHLNLRGNKGGKKIIQIVRQILTEKDLTTLIMSRMELGPRLFNDICLGLAKARQLQTIDFSYNAIDDKGFNSLILILQQSQTLNNVDLRENKIDPKHLEKIVELMQENPRFQTTNIKV